MVTKDTTFSDRERDMIVAYFKSLKATPECDYAKMAELVGLKNKKSAADGFRPILKKLMGGNAATSLVQKGGTGDDGDAEDGSVKATPKKRKGAATSDATPSKKRAPSKKSQKSMEEETEAGDDEEEVEDVASGGIKNEEL